LTQKLLLYDCYDTDNEHEQINYNYFILRQQRYCLIYGYCQINDGYIPIDIINLIFQLFDSMLSWNINGKTMKQFKAAKFKEMMIGPKLDLGGATLALTIYPKGWISQDKTSCYLEMINKDEKHIECVQANVTFWIREVNLMYRTSMILNRVGGGVGIHSSMLPFDQLIKLKSFTLEADVNVQGIKFAEDEETKTILPPIITEKIPEIQDTEFMWNIDDDILQRMKCNIKNNEISWVEYSHIFGNECMILEFMRGSKGNKLGLKLFRVPINVRYYVTDIIWTVYFNNHRMSVKNENVTLKIQKRSWMPIGMDDMTSVNMLSFKVEIKVKEIQRD